MSADSTSATSFLTREVSAAFHQFDTGMQKLRRAQEIAGFARRYAINSRLANDIHAAAVKADIDPDLAFRLVKLESDFDEQATSPVGAIGLTQLMLATAQEYDSTLTADMLYDRRLNLKLGLRYLRDMLREHDGHVMLALAAYNRGPGTVRNLIAQGRVPSNAYERVIMRGYTGRGTLD
jgi:soluble lytic murein transglycosylase-like protein